MKTLLILRHAKSSWENKSLRDFDRPLLNKGIERTKRIADFILKNNINIEYVVSSPAIRTIETAHILAHQIGFASENIVKDFKLYFEEIEPYFEAVFSISDNIQTAMIIGHNQMITDFVNWFADKSIENLPTSGLAVFDFDTDNWKDIAMGKRQTRFIIFPKNLNINEN